MEGLLLALEQSGFAAAMRSSLFLFPTANVIHILAVMGFFAAVAAMDFRLLRATSVADVRTFSTRLRPVAAILLLLQLGSGIMLLAPEASHVWHNPVFRVKLLAILIGLANGVMLEGLFRRTTPGTITAGMRAMAVVSLVMWLSAAALGRLIAYF
jgi:hypothetical protein